MYGLPSPDVTSKFLEYVIKNNLLVDFTDDNFRKDYIKDEILKLDIDKHKAILDSFPDVRNFIERWFPIQTVDAGFSSDLRVMDAGNMSGKDVTSVD